MTLVFLYPLFYLFSLADLGVLEMSWQVDPRDDICPNMMTSIKQLCMRNDQPTSMSWMMIPTRILEGVKPSHSKTQVNLICWCWLPYRWCVPAVWCRAVPIRPNLYESRLPLHQKPRWASSPSKQQSGVHFSLPRGVGATGVRPRLRRLKTNTSCAEVYGAKERDPNSVCLRWTSSFIKVFSEKLPIDVYDYVNLFDFISECFSMLKCTSRSAIETRSRFGSRHLLLLSLQLLSPPSPVPPTVPMPGLMPGLARAEHVTMAAILMANLTVIKLYINGDSWL